MFQSLAVTNRQGPFTEHRMKHRLIIIGVASLMAASGFAQFPPGPRAAAAGPNFTGAMARLFGTHPAFSANLEIQSGTNEQMKIPGKLAFSDGKSRFEMDLNQSSKTASPRVEQMKAMGMDQMIIINRPDRK